MTSGTAGRHTPGPWMWQANPAGDIRLATPDRGNLTVMDFARKGMQRAEPRFAVWQGVERERLGGIMHGVTELIEKEGDLVHPDALLIAAAPDLHEALNAAFSELHDQWHPYMSREEFDGHPLIRKIRAALSRAGSPK